MRSTCRQVAGTCVVKDVILHIIGSLGSDRGRLQVRGVQSAAQVSRMSIASRMVLSNMSIEMGAKAGICCPIARPRTGCLRGPPARWRWTSCQTGKADEELEMDVEELEPGGVPAHRGQRRSRARSRERGSTRRYWSCTTGALRTWPQQRPSCAVTRYQRMCGSSWCASREIYIERRRRACCHHLQGPERS